jgi:hypothetical protein
MRQGHTATFRGRTVYVVLKSGERFIDKFVERTSGRVVILKERGRVPCGDIRSLSDRKLGREVSRWRR